MRGIILAAGVAFVMGGIGTGAVMSAAQTVSQLPPAGLDGPPPPQPRPWMDMRRGMGHGGGREEMLQRRRTFALIYPQKDRALTPADVQKIAEGFLLWNGNHAWKVADVAPTSDGPIAFSLTTQDGSTIAKFTMDPHTGRVERVG